MYCGPFACPLQAFLLLPQQRQQLPFCLYVEPAEGSAPQHVISRNNNEKPLRLTATPSALAAAAASGDSTLRHAGGEEIKKGHMPRSNKTLSKVLNKKCSSSLRVKCPLL